MLKLILTLATAFNLFATKADASTRSVSVPRTMKALARLFPDNQGTMPLFVYQTHLQQTPAILREYTRAKLDEEGRSDEDLEGFHFVFDSKVMPSGYDIVGTLNKQSAFREVIESVQQIYDEQLPPSESLKLQQRARDLMIDLKDAGVIYGFDSSRRNACNRFTKFMIFLDKTSDKIYGIDLDPCWR